MAKLVMPVDNEEDETCRPTIEQAERMMATAKALYDEENIVHMTKEHDVLAIVGPDGTLYYLNPDFDTVEEVVTHLNRVGRGRIGDGK